MDLLRSPSNLRAHCNSILAWPAGVSLLLWAPPGGADGARTPASRALDGYNARFAELCRMQDEVASGGTPLLMASWEAFMSRWLSAATAAVKVNACAVLTSADCWHRLHGETQIPCSAKQRLLLHQETLQGMS